MNNTLEDIIKDGNEQRHSQNGNHVVLEGYEWDELINTFTFLHDTYQDCIQNLMADLETGSHHFNNHAYETFTKKYNWFYQSFSELGIKIDKLQVGHSNQGDTNAS
jgi:hypothetical protein